MPRADTHDTRRQNESGRRWHPFSWRRMTTRDVWILVAVAVVFAIIGLLMT